MPLARTFKNSFEMAEGCSRGERCFCRNTGRGCTPKRVVYQAKCEVCKIAGKDAKYVGETAGQAGVRIQEHLMRASSLCTK